MDRFTAFSHFRFTETLALHELMQYDSTMRSHIRRVVCGAGLPIAMMLASCQSPSPDESNAWHGDGTPSSRYSRPPTVALGRDLTEVTLLDTVRPDQVIGAYVGPGCELELLQGGKYRSTFHGCSMRTEEEGRWSLHEEYIVLVPRKTDHPDGIPPAWRMRACATNHEIVLVHERDVPMARWKGVSRDTAFAPLPD